MMDDTPVNLRLGDSLSVPAVGPAVLERGCNLSSRSRSYSTVFMLASDSEDESKSRTSTPSEVSRH